MALVHRIFLSCDKCGTVLTDVPGEIPSFTRDAEARTFAITVGWERTPSPQRKDICPDCRKPLDQEAQLELIKPGSMVEVSYTGCLLATPEGYSRVVSTGDDPLDRWINVLPAHANVIPALDNAKEI